MLQRLATFRRTVSSSTKGLGGLSSTIVSVVRSVISTRIGLFFLPHLFDESSKHNAGDFRRLDLDVAGNLSANFIAVLHNVFHAGRKEAKKYYSRNCPFF